VKRVSLQANPARRSRLNPAFRTPIRSTRAPSLVSAVEIRLSPFRTARDAGWRKRTAGPRSRFRQDVPR
jgi:hypothetical protein